MLHGVRRVPPGARCALRYVPPSATRGAGVAQELALGPILYDSLLKMRVSIQALATLRDDLPVVEPLGPLPACCRDFKLDWSPSRYERLTALLVGFVVVAAGLLAFTKCRRTHHPIQARGIARMRMHGYSGGGCV
jgi:hypothetical protein